MAIPTLDEISSFTTTTTTTSQKSHDLVTPLTLTSELRQSANTPLTAELRQSTNDSNSSQHHSPTMNEESSKKHVPIPAIPITAPTSEPQIQPPQSYNLVKSISSPLDEESSIKHISIPAVPIVETQTQPQSFNLVNSSSIPNSLRVSFKAESIAESALSTNAIEISSINIQLNDDHIPPAVDTSIDRGLEQQQQEQPSAPADAHLSTSYSAPEMRSHLSTVESVEPPPSDTVAPLSGVPKTALDLQPVPIDKRAAFSKKRPYSFAGPQKPKPTTLGTGSFSVGNARHDSETAPTHLHDVKKRMSFPKSQPRILSRQRSEKEVLVGTPVKEGHVNYMLMYDMLTGIRISVCILRVRVSSLGLTSL